MSIFSPALPECPADGVVVRAPAKLNLYLGVGDTLPGSNYHSLATVYCALSLFDDVVARPSAGGIVVQAHTPSAGVELANVPLDRTNLVYRAAELLADYAGVSAPDVELTIVKRIPVAAGLAGGSADAAAALVGCDALWQTGLSKAELLQLAAQLGADVPFSVHGGVAVGTGHGQQLTPAAVGPEPMHWVLAVSESALSTPTVFAEFDRLTQGQTLTDPVVPDAVLRAVRSADPRALAAVIQNDLQEPACSLLPGLRAVLQAGQQAGALASVVSGSGPTVGFLASDEKHALELCVTLAAVSDVRVLERARGPVPGARVVLSPSVQKDCQ